MKLPKKTIIKHDFVFVNNSVNECRIDHVISGESRIWIISSGSFVIDTFSGDIEAKLKRRIRVKLEN